MTTVHDPENYRKMCEPHATEEEANEAVQKFYEAVRKARQKYRIADVEIIVRVKARPSEENEKTGMFFSSAHFGSLLERVGMCAWAHGIATQELHDVMTEMAKKVKE